MTREIRGAIAKKFTLLFAAVIIVNLFFEVFVRTTGLSKSSIVWINYKSTFEESGEFEISTDPKLSYVRTPARCIYRQSEVVEENCPAANSLGMRDFEYPPKSEKKRILFLGDSVVYGSGVKFEETLPKQLEAILNAPPAEMGPVEVLNAGMPGYNSVQEERYFEIIAGKIAPDIVILGYSLNDNNTLYQVKKVDGAYRFVSECDRCPYLYPFPGNGIMLEHSYFYRHINLVMTDIARRLGYSHLIKFFYCGGGTLEERAEDALLRIRENAGGMGASLIIVVFPLFADFNRYEYFHSHRWIAEQAAALGVPIIDLFEHYRTMDASELRVSPDDIVHPNALGHALAARILASFLLAGN